MLYDVILKNGLIIKDVEPKDTTRDIISLWKWSRNRITDTILDFKNASINSSDISAILESSDNLDNIEGIE